MATSPTFTQDHLIPFGWQWGTVPFGGEGDESGDGGNAGSGGDGGAGNASGQAGQGNSSQGGSGNGSDGGNNGSGSDSDDEDEDDEYEGYSAKELKRIARDNKKAAKEAAAEAKKLKDKEEAEQRKKNDDVTNLTKDLETERETVKTLRATVVKQAIEGAIRDDARFEWHDVEMVANVAVKINPEISVTDEGKVEGLKATLPKVAKQHGFMVKKDNTDQGNNGANNSNGGGQQNNGPTGFQPGQGGTSGGSGNDIDQKALAENYPALAQRI